jgi:hypothetical protein
LKKPGADAAARGALGFDIGRHWGRLEFILGPLRGGLLYNLFPRPI